ncbi:hypothetical protein Efla_004960 [Eimeria flavescens]
MAALCRPVWLALVCLLAAAAACCPSAARTLSGPRGFPVPSIEEGGGPLASRQPPLGCQAACSPKPGSLEAPQPGACFLWRREKPQQQQQQQRPSVWGSWLGLRGPKKGRAGSSATPRGFRLLPEKSAAYAVLSIPVEVALHPAAHGALLHAARLLQRLQLLLLLSGAAAATALAMAVAVPRLIILRGGADLLLLPMCSTAATPAAAADAAAFAAC